MVCFFFPFSIMCTCMHCHVLRTDMFTVLVVILHITVAEHGEQISDYLGSNILKLDGLGMHLNIQWS